MKFADLCLEYEFPHESAYDRNLSAKVIEKYDFKLEFNMIDSLLLWKAKLKIKNTSLYVQWKLFDKETGKFFAH